MRHLAKYSLIFLVALLLANLGLSSAHGGGSLLITNDEGGDIAAYKHYWRQVSKKYDRVVIDGPCKSSCTLLLGVIPANRICLTSQGSLLFHAAHKWGDRNTIGPEPTKIMRDFYPSHIQKWLDANGVQKSLSFTPLPDSLMNGIKRCERPSDAKTDDALIAERINFRTLHKF